VEAVIAGQDDDGVVAIRAGLQRVNNSPNLLIHERHAGQVSLDE
jgi:hypothetical protein